MSGRIARAECVLARSRRNRERDKVRYKLFLLRKQERHRLLTESFWEKEKAELIAVEPFYLLDVAPGEVLFDQRGHVSPALGAF